MDARYVSCTESAKLIRKELKANFSGIKFSVKSSSYAGGASISIRWTDGPTRKSVEKITNKFEGARFDGMYDSTEYVESEYQGEKVRFGSDYVMASRNFSRVFLTAIVAQFCKSWGIPMLEIMGSDEDAWANTSALDVSQDHWLKDLISKTDGKDMHRVYEAEKEQKEREHAEWMAGEPARQEKARQEQAEYERQQAQRKEREAKQKAERDRQQREQRQRNAFSTSQRQALYSREHALAYFGLRSYASKNEVMNAFREKVKSMADGKGGYTGDMDLLVKVKEKALQ